MIVGGLIWAVTTPGKARAIKVRVETEGWSMEDSRSSNGCVPITIPNIALLLDLRDLFPLIQALPTPLHGLSARAQNALTIRVFRPTAIYGSSKTHPTSLTARPGSRPPAQQPHDRHKPWTSLRSQRAFSHDPRTQEARPREWDPVGRAVPPRLGTVELADSCVKQPDTLTGSVEAQSRRIFSRHFAMGTYGETVVPA